MAVVSRVGADASSVLKIILSELPGIEENITFGTNSSSLWYAELSLHLTDTSVLRLYKRGDPNVQRIHVAEVERDIIYKKLQELYNIDIYGVRSFTLRLEINKVPTYISEGRLTLKAGDDK